MNKAILVAIGMFTLMNTVVSLVSHQVWEVEMTETIPSQAMADSSARASLSPAAVDTAVTDETAPLIHELDGGSDMTVPEPVEEPATPVASASEDVPEPPHVAEQSTMTETPDITIEAESQPPAPMTPPVSVVIPAPASGDRTQEPVTSTLPAPLSAADSLLLLIPELAWPDSHRTRREISPEIASEYPHGKFVPRTVTNTAWGVGEHLEFSIDYGFYTAGTATMSVLAEEMVNGSNSFHIQTTAHSNDFISKLYKVRDQVNSYIDRQGIFSRRIEKILREGDYRSDRFVDFYPDRKIAVSTVDKHPVTEIPLYVQDVLSSLYLIRTYPLEVGKDFNITTYADGKVYPLRVTVHKMETVNVPAGKFRCYVVEPFLQSDGIFRQKGKLTVWLTADEHRIPVKMTSKIVIGSIGTNLTKYRLGATE